MKQINLKQWDRYEHYLYFKDFKNPFFNICADLDVSNLKRLAINNNLSFFILSIYKLLIAINYFDEFKYRIRENGVICYDSIRAGCTIMRKNRTFGFAYFKYHEDFEHFYLEATNQIEQVKKSTSIDPQTGIDDMVYTSVLPWISFKSIEHAQNNNDNDSIPKIVFGKLIRKQRNFFMPVSVSAHHSLMDALHVGEFFNYYEELCKNADKTIRYKAVII